MCSQTEYLLCIYALRDVPQNLRSFPLCRDGCVCEENCRVPFHENSMEIICFKKENWKKDDKPHRRVVCIYAECNLYVLRFLLPFYFVIFGRFILRRGFNLWLCCTRGYFRVFIQVPSTFIDFGLFYLKRWVCEFNIMFHECIWF